MRGFAYRRYCHLEETSDLAIGSLLSFHPFDITSVRESTLFDFVHHAHYEHVVEEAKYGDLTSLASIS